jgi:hypothetical protein
MQLISCIHARAYMCPHTCTLKAVVVVVQGGTMPARGLVGGDAGSMRQAAPYKPGESKAGNIQEGWTEDQLDQMLENEVRHAA